jgi:hypothetical protein
MTPFETFMRGPWMIVIFAILFSVVVFIVAKGWLNPNTKPPGNQENTGQPWKPGPQQPIPDNRPKPEPPRKDVV